MPRIVILISGRGSNMAAIVQAGLPAQIAAVISNRPEAPGLVIAQRLGVATEVVDHKQYPGREEFDTALGERIAAHEPDVIALAGFMRILTPGFIARFAGRLLNIHPSLLPLFPGLHTHSRALEAGVRIHGCTVHFVTNALDGGPIVVQAAVPVLAGDTEAALEARVLEQEHRIYPQAIRWLLEGHVRLEASRVLTEGLPASC